MIYEPTLSSLFHELFASPWPEDDPQFVEEIKHYRSVIQRLLTIDNQIDHYIKNQPLLDNDQIASIPCATELRKVQILASAEPSQNSNQILFTMTVSPCNIGSIFSSVVVETGHKKFEYKASEKSTDSINASCEFIPNSSITVTAHWNLPLFRLSQNLQKFMGSPFGIAGEIAQKILAHIDSRGLLATSEGDIKCDKTLQSITDRETIQISEISDVIEKNTIPIEPFSFKLDLPKSSRSFSIQVPFFPSVEMSDFEPLNLPPPPIKPFLEAAIESKKQLLLQEAFERNPVGFINESVTKEAKTIGTSDITDSTYFFMQPWVVESASDYIKSSEYIANSKKPTPTPTQTIVTPQYR